MALARRSAAKLAEAISGRDGADGVRWVLQGPPLRQVVRRELRHALTEPELLGICRLRRARFRPGSRLSAWYDVGLRSGSASVPSSESRQVAVTWTARRGDGARRAENATAAIATAAVDAGLAGPFRSLAAEVPGLGLRLLVWPVDPSHPQLIRVADPRHVREMLAAVAAIASSPSALRPSGYAVRAVRYRPGQRHVLRYDPVGSADGGADGPALFAKLYRAGGAARAFEVAEWIAARMRFDHRGVTAVQPVAWVPDDDVVLYAELAGEPLTRRLGEPDAALARHLELAGAALRDLHGIAPPGDTAGLTAFDLGAELRSLAGAAGRLGAVLPGAGAGLASLLDRATAVHERLPPEAPVLAHGDYKADHLWVAPGGRCLTVIDFDSCYLAEPAVDLGKFLADLQWWYAGRTAHTLAWARQRFLDGYAGAGEPSARHVPSARLRRARLYEALALGRITSHRVRIFDRAWADHTEALIARAAEILTELECVR
jgi:aminoglycoside phosphotransferase (APT) family kinase protein